MPDKTCKKGHVYSAGRCPICRQAWYVRWYAKNKTKYIREKCEWFKENSKYQIWQAMRRRCNNPSDAGYERYGGRGINICSRWQEYPAFLEDMGRRPNASYTIERNDNDGNYEPGNCRWATRTEQARNRRSNRMLTFNGISLCLEEWAARIGIKRTTLRQRLDVLNWPLERALANEKGGGL